MGLILWIDQNTFATRLIEKVFKKRDLPFYSLDKVDDFAYLVEDISPVLVVLDGATFDKNPDAFRTQYHGSAKMQSLPFIIIDGDADFSFLKVKIGELHKPLDPFSVPEVISKIYSVS